MCVNITSCNSGLLRYVGGFSRGVTAMLDLIMLAMGLGFFAVAVGYAYACERL